MELRAIEPDSAPFSRMTGLLGEAGLPTDDLRAEPARYYALMAGREPVAFAGIVPLGREGMLRSLVVPNERRGGGIGRSAVEALLAEARSQGIGRLWLLTTSAKEFFGRQGWQTADRREAPAAIAASRQFTVSCPASAVLMWRTLA